MRYPFLIVLSCIALAGCQVPSMSVQRSALRASGDLASTVYLETRNVNDVEPIKRDIVRALDSMTTFLNEGDVSKLPLGELAAKLRDIIPPQYHLFVNQVLAVVSGANVDVSKAIGADNVKRIRSFIRGGTVGASSYDANDRMPVGADPPTTAPETGSGTAGDGGT